MRKNDNSTGGKLAKGFNDFLCFIKVKFEKGGSQVYHL